MPFPNELAARQTSPKGFASIKRQNNKFGRGIHAIWGIKSDGKSVLQSIRFSKAIFNPAKAKQWLKAKNFKTAIESVEGEHMKFKLDSLKTAMTWATDWIESAHSHSFDDINDAVALAVANKFPIGEGDHVHTGYFVYKLWEDKVVVKRSWSNENEDDALFLRMSYISEDTPDIGLTITLGDAAPVKLAFVPINTEPADNMLMASREVDLTNIEEEMYTEIAKAEKDPVKHVKEAGPIELDEHFRTSPLKDATIDKDNLIIRGVKMLGPVSTNGRTYPIETQQAAVSILEGVKAFLDHPTEEDRNEPRRVRDLIGQHLNVRVEGDSTFSDLHLVNTALVMEVVLPIAESNASLMGNSIMAQGKMNEKNVVTEITSVRSVDLVAEPATTKGLFESGKTFKEKPKQSKGDIDMSTKEDVLKDAKLTAELKAHFHEGFKAEMEKSKEWNELKAKVETAEAATKEADKKLLAIETAEAKAEEGRKITKMIADSKLPDEIKKGDKLRGLLEGAKDEEARKAIILYMEEAAEKGTPPDPSLNPEKKVVVEGQITEATYTKAFNALGSNRASL